MKKILALLFIIGTLLFLIGCSSVNISVTPPSSLTNSTTPSPSTDSNIIVDAGEGEELYDRAMVNLNTSNQILDFFCLDITNEQALEAFVEKYKGPNSSNYLCFSDTEQVKAAYNRFYGFGIVPIVKNYSLMCDCTVFYDETFGLFYDKPNGVVEIRYRWVKGNTEYIFTGGRLLDENENYVDIIKSKHGYEPELVYTIEDQNIKVYKERMPEELPKTRVDYTILIDRTFIYLSYFDKESDSVRDHQIEQILQNVEFLPIDDVEWSSNFIGGGSDG